MLYEVITGAKYRLCAKDGTVIDDTIDDTYKRVARALADVEMESQREEWYEKFVWALRSGAIPAGRIISNAGAQQHKPATSTINCTVSGTVADSMDNILNKVHEAGLTLKARITSYNVCYTKLLRVFAAPEFSLEPKTWCYPVAGCVAYRGYFSYNFV